MPLLNTKDLCLGYDGKTIVENLNFSIEEKDYLCVLGENGAGKSTLMKTLLHLQKPISGSIEYDKGLKSTEIGYLPQQSVIQREFPATVWEVVLSGCLNKIGFKPFYSKKEKDLAHQNIKKMGLEGFEKRCYRELSGGQQQRVLLARALCATSKVLLLDEPVSGLDPKVTQEMYSLIKKLNEEEGITIIMISHDIHSAVKYANKILHISHKPYFGSVEDYLKEGPGKRFIGGDE